MGYDYEVSAWRFWKPDTDMVILSRSASFDETAVPRVPPPSPPDSPSLEQQTTELRGDTNTTNTHQDSLSNSLSFKSPELGFGEISSSDDEGPARASRPGANAGDKSNSGSNSTSNLENSNVQHTPEGGVDHTPPTPRAEEVSLNSAQRSQQEKLRYLNELTASLRSPELRPGPARALLLPKVKLRNQRLSHSAIVKPLENSSLSQGRNTNRPNGTCWSKVNWTI